tara:strand:+ start:125 stop:334 length:210 start_codon:yes stop_codon:yes gene_type:complete
LRDDVTASQDEERIEKLRHIEGIARAGTGERSLRRLLIIGACFCAENPIIPDIQFSRATSVETHAESPS